MKKKIMFLILIAITFLGINSVEARECQYTYKGNDITLNFAKEENSDIFKVTYKYENGFDSKYDVPPFEFVDAALITSDDQCIKALTVCELTVRDLPIGMEISFGSSLVTLPIVIANEFSKEKYLAIFGSSLDSLTIDDVYANEFDASNKSIWENSFWTGRGVSCEVAEYTGEKLDSSKFVSYCDKFVQLYSNVANSYKEYAACGEVEGTNSEKASISRCRSNALSDVNKHTDTLKTTCDNILQNQSLSISDGCVYSCLQANKSIKVLKENYIGIENFNNDCSISSKLIIWLANIVRWIKYIIPVAVMVLGILDFIKAIAAGKDDEMKKAQGAFVKRLIAAALIFIIPFIIEFVLDIMGFDRYIDGCGIIDL